MDPDTDSRITLVDKRDDGTIGTRDNRDAP